MVSAGDLRSPALLCSHLLVSVPQLVLGGFVHPSAAITAPCACRFLQLQPCHCYGDSGIALGAHRDRCRVSTLVETIPISVAAVLEVGAAGWWPQPSAVSLPSPCLSLASLGPWPARRSGRGSSCLCWSKAQQGHEQRRHMDEARDASGAGSPWAGTEYWAGPGVWGSRHQRTGGSTMAACLSKQKVRGSPGGERGLGGRVKPVLQ